MLRSVPFGRGLNFASFVNFCLKSVLAPLADVALAKFALRPPASPPETPSCNPAHIVTRSVSGGDVGIATRSVARRSWREIFLGRTYLRPNRQASKIDDPRLAFGRINEDFLKQKLAKEAKVRQLSASGFSPLAICHLSFVTPFARCWLLAICYALRRLAFRPSAVVSKVKIRPYAS